MSVEVDSSKCIGCGTCAAVCPVNAVVIDQIAVIDPEICNNCGACIDKCPQQALSWEALPVITPSYQVVSTSYSPVHAPQPTQPAPFHRPVAPPDSDQRRNKGLLERLINFLTRFGDPLQREASGSRGGMGRGRGGRGMGGGRRGGGGQGRGGGRGRRGGKGRGGNR